MKKLSLLLLLTITLTSLFAQTVKFSTPTPEQGKPLKFVYDPKGNNLAKLAATITCSVKAISSPDNRINIPVKLTKVGSVYEGEFTPKDSTSLAVLIFKAGDTMDDNPNGYYTKFYKNATQIPMSIFLEGYLYAGLGYNIAKIKTDHQKAIMLYKQAFDADAKLKERYFSNYLSVQYNLDKVKGEKQAYETITQYNKLEPSETNLSRIASLYAIINNKVAADSVYNLIETNYPKGPYAFSALLNKLKLIKGADEREKKLHEVAREFNLDLNIEADAAKVARIFPGLGIAFLAAKNYEKAEFYIDRIESKATKAALYNSFAMRDNVEINLPFYEKIAKKAIDFTQSAMNDEESAIYYNSKEEYMELLNSNYIMYKGVYAGILAMMGKNSDALAAMEDVVTRNNYSDIDLNTKYVNFLIKNNKNNEALSYAERFIKEGKEGDGLKDLVKTIYRGSIVFDDYYMKLKKEAETLQKEEIKKEMINIIAPKFSLMTLDGKKVDLATLKGKVVIVDYWATWCGPCMQSFPAMQVAVDKYKNDPNIVFLFINTWERGENREKAVKNWMLANSKYKFTVLLDRENSNDPNRFETVDNYNVEGIPTKFIVDGNGNIRFKKVGFSGSIEGTVKELDLMIEMAKAASGKPQSK